MWSGVLGSVMHIARLRACAQKFDLFVQVVFSGMSHRLVFLSRREGNVANKPDAHSQRNWFQFIFNLLVASPDLYFRPRYYTWVVFQVGRRSREPEHWYANGKSRGVARR